MTPIPRDFRDFIGLLNARRVRYLVVGGYAVAFHGYEYWMKLMVRVKTTLKAKSAKLTLEDALSELAEKRAMTASLVFSGAAEFTAGEISQIIDPIEDDNFFARYLERKQDKEKAAIATAKAQYKL
jgi:hypothetical protein